MMTIREAITRLVEGHGLTSEESIDVMNGIMTGDCTDAQIGAYLTALRLKGETVEEITGSAKVMREKATLIQAPDDVIDTCGTGGDCQNTVNVSTAAAIVAASGGAHVAKHGNRSVSSSSGSSQVLEELGVNISADVPTVERCIADTGIGFLFAPRLHGAMKYAIGPRKEMGIRTIFNILGPLTNPARARRQLMGVYAPELVDTMALVLREMGAERAVVAHGHDGMDEITICDETSVAFLNNGDIENMVLAPEDFGMKRADVSDIQVNSAAESAALIRSVFAGEQGAARDIIMLNAGAALYVAGKVADISDGVTMAGELLDNGKATQTLDALVKVSHS